MLMRKNSIHKTKKFILKTLKNLTNFLFGGYQNIQTTHPLDHIHDHDQDNADRLINQLMHTIPSTDHDVDDDDAKKMKAKKQGATKRKVEPTPSYCSSSSSSVLAHKMKELEMMDLSDVDQSLDVEEALHYYSRLTSPVYVEIVNKFFMDMYTEYLLPQPPICTISSSSRRLGPLVL